MKKKKKLVWPLLAAIVLLLNLVFPYIVTTQVAKAADVDLDKTEFLKEVTLHYGNVKPTDSTKLTSGNGEQKDPYKYNIGSPFKINYHFKLPDGANVVTTTDEYFIEIPTGLVFKDADGSTGKVTSSDGQSSVGEVKIDGDKLRVTFNSDFVTKQNREFYIYFDARFADSNNIPTSAYELKFNSVSSIYIMPTPNSKNQAGAFVLNKNGSVKFNATTQKMDLNWSLILSYANEFSIPAGAKIVDKIPSDQKLVTNSFSSSLLDGTDPSIEINTISANEFVVTFLKEVKTGQSINYKTEALELNSDLRWTNKAVYTGVKDTAGNEKTVGIGKEYPGITVSEYTVNGVAAYDFGLGGGGSGNLPTMKVTKKWEIGDTPPTKIDVNILQDGELYRTVELNAGNNWMMDVAIYPILSSDGTKAINYTVKEVPVAGYDKNPTITGDQATGFTITNKKIKDITVTKQWLDDGNNGAVDATVTGKVGSTEVSSQNITLDPAKDFKVTLENLPFFKDGQEINYTVKEKNVPTGFKSDVTGNEQDGFTITNTHG